MANHNRSFALAYVFLVVLPVVGLAGVLRGGRGLVAPISLGGTWKIQAGPAALASMTCSSMASSQTPNLVIIQSGKNFTLNLAGYPRPVGAGEIEGTAVSASVPLAASGACIGKTVKLAAKVDPKLTPRAMDGTLALNDCATCAPIAFHATQEDQAKAKGGH